MRPPTLGRIDQSAWSVLTRRTAHKGVLLCGYCSYLVALLRSYRDPATEYELSIYAQTATPVWIAIGLALTCSVFVALVAARRETTAAATLLGVLSITTVAALPLVRGYTFYGSGDALTHLGWTREFAAGSRGVTSLIYPASHLSSVGLARVTGTSIQRAMLVVVVLTAVLYVVFVLLTVWLLDIDHRGVALAGFSGLMLLPLTNVATHLQFHPYTMTVFLVPLVCYLLVRYVPMPPPARRLFGTGSPAGVLLALVLVSIILFHPQPAVNVLIVLVSVALLQRYRRRKLPAGAAEQLRSVAPMALFFGLALFLWVLPHEKFYALLFGLVDSMIEAVEGTETVGQNVKQRGGSLQDVGVSLQEMFLRLFLVQAVYVGLTVVVVLTNVLGTVRESRPTTSTTRNHSWQDTNARSKRQHRVCSSLASAPVPVGTSMHIEQQNGSKPVTSSRRWSLPRAI